MSAAPNALFKSLADPTRRAIFERLVHDGEQTVQVLTDRSGVSQPAVSKHLGVLKLAGLVRDRRQGRQTHYSAQPDALTPLMDWITLYGAFWRDRFDRLEGGRHRRMLVSALTILNLDVMMARYATYYDLADAIRSRFAEPKQALRELFSRITFNICVGNTDDHARNHAAFWDGTILTLTPAYDICPQPRSGGEATQAMAIRRDGYRYSQLAGCVAAASNTYLLSKNEAKDIIDHQVGTIRAQWDEAADVTRLTSVERNQLWGRQILNPYALEDAA